MKVFKRSSSRLIFQSGSSSFRVCLFQYSLGLAAIAFPALGILSRAYSLGVAILRCDRLGLATISCQQKRTHLFGLIEEKPQRWGNLTHTIVVPDTRTKGKGNKHIANLLYGIDVTGNWHSIGSYRDVHSVARNINEFIRTPSSPTLKIVRDYRFDLELLSLSLLISPLVLIGLLICANTGHQKRLEFNKTQNYTQLSNFNLITKKARIINRIPLDETEIEAIEDLDINCNSRYRIVIKGSGIKFFEVRPSLEREEVIAMLEMLKAFLSPSRHE
ncbi:MAG: hypothetical protein AAGA60_04065 [Cyanobacteria bacterium P01_E01_bin.42]